MIAPLLLLLGAARADDASYDHASLSAGVEALPDTWGEPGWRDSLAVALASRRGPILIDVAADFRSGTWVDIDDADALRRLSVSWLPAYAEVQLGRHLHEDARGALHLDGLSARFMPGAAVRPALWGGRAWRVDTGAPVDGALVGGELGIHPSRSGFGLLPGGAVGAEVHVVDSELLPRGFAAFGASSLRGTSIDLRAELGQDDGALAARAAGHARLPLTGGVDAGLDLGWEELPPAEVVGQLDSPLSWLAPDGYGRAELSLISRGDGLNARIQGGPVLRQRGEADAALGGAGSVGVRLGDSIPLDVTLRGVTLGPSGYAGATLGTAARGDLLSWDGGAAVYRMQGLDERAAWVGEIRLAGERELLTGQRGALSVRLGTAAGVDRLLQPWWRGGLLLTGRMEGA